jgi:hypothetical protein
MEVAKQRASLAHSPSAPELPEAAADRDYILPPDQDEPDQDYRAVLDWVWSFSSRQRTADEIIGGRAIKLDRMRALLRALDDPHLVVP